MWGDEKGSGKISMNLSLYVSIRFSSYLPTFSVYLTTNKSRYHIYINQNEW